MAKFITLHDTSNDIAIINIEHVEVVEKSAEIGKDGTRLTYIGMAGRCLYVKESVNEIKRLINE